MRKQHNTKATPLRATFAHTNFTHPIAESEEIDYFETGIKKALSELEIVMRESGFLKPKSKKKFKTAY